MAVPPPSSLIPPSPSHPPPQRRRPPVHPFLDMATGRPATGRQATGQRGSATEEIAALQGQVEELKARCDAEEAEAEKMRAKTAQLVSELEASRKEAEEAQAARLHRLCLLCPSGRLVYHQWLAFFGCRRYRQFRQLAKNPCDFCL